ncbi:MAG: hypothetical protein WCV90_07685 [Candidatus Woesearchaeota archaeon]|jgi:hypothetical protein
MVLVPILTDEQIARHKELIMKYFSEAYGRTPGEIETHRNGNEKGVYKVFVDDNVYLAAAASLTPERRLLKEYTVLHQLYDGAPDLFPRPIAHYSPENVQASGDLIIMEFLPHQNIMEFDKFSYRGKEGFHRALAYTIGRSVAIVQRKTGRYSSEPHDGNILVKLGPEGQLDLRFCDAIQFLEGSLEQAVEALLVNRDERPESFRFIKELRKGLAESLSQLDQVPYASSWDSLDFLRQYNDIF